MRDSSSQPSTEFPSTIMLGQKQNPEERCGALRRISLLGFTAITDQTNQKKNFDSVAKQHFQNSSWFGLERKALHVLTYLTIAITSTQHELVIKK